MLPLLKHAARGETRVPDVESKLADEFGFRVLDGRQPVDRIQQELRRQIGAFLAEPASGSVPEPAVRPGA